MADPVFRSRLSTDIEAFIIQKRAAGYPYINSTKILGYLDSMIAEEYPDSEELSKDICNAWIIVAQLSRQKSKIFIMN